MLWATIGNVLNARESYCIAFYPVVYFNYVGSKLVLSPALKYVPTCSHTAEQDVNETIAFSLKHKEAYKNSRDRGLLYQPVQVLEISIKLGQRNAIS